MKKKKYILIFMLPLLLWISKVNASCSTTMREEFEQIADQYYVTYEYDEEADGYIITFYKPENSNFGFYYGSTDEIINGDLECEVIEGCSVGCTAVSGAKIASCKYYKPGEHTIYVVGATSECSGDLKEIELNLPYHNQYANSDACKGYEDFVLCNENYDKEITEEEFSKRLQAYIGEKEEEEDQPEEENNELKKIYNTVILYIKGHLVYAIASLILFIVILISTIYLIRKAIKRRKLE